MPKAIPPSQGSGLDEALAQANPAGHCVQFKWAPPREYIPAGHGTIAKLKKNISFHVITSYTTNNFVLNKETTM